MLYTVYILYSEKHSQIYIGYTSHLINRFHSHNQYGTKDWTRNFRPWVVVYCEYHESKTNALKREKQLKSGIARAAIRAKLLIAFKLQGYITNL